MIGDAHWRFRARFGAAAHAAKGTALQAYYAVPPPDFATPLGDIPILAIDFETDGLDPKANPILEVGAVELRGGSIDLGTALRHRIRPEAALRSDAVIIHRLTDDALAREKGEREVLEHLVPRLAGRALLAHFAGIEAGFLSAACQRCFGAPFVAPMICTMQLETRWFAKSRRADGLRLGVLRAGYGLPDYSTHNGLIDALACAELYLAQMAKRGGACLTLGDVLRR
jgi:DNA polymerase-3 subunit epsilon